MLELGLLVGIGVALFLAFPRRRRGTQLIKPVLRWIPEAQTATWNRDPLRLEQVLGLMFQESGGDPNPPPQPAGEIGLMQITPIALEDYNQRNGTSITQADLRNPAANIEVGAWTLWRRLIEMRGDVFDAMRAYRCGAAGAKRNHNCGADSADRIVRQWIPAVREALRARGVIA